MKTILVTGCAGFIGSHFTHTFLEKFPKTQIVGIDDFSSGIQKNLPKDRRFTFYKGSITNEKLVADIFSKHKPEYVFHFAAIPRVSYSVEHPTETTDVNITGTVLLLENASKHQVKRFIFSSSSSVYGGAKKLPTTEKENPPKPVSPYAGQKYAGEIFCKIFSDLYNLDTVCLRYFNVFGPGQLGSSPYSTVIAAWLEWLVNPKKILFLEGDGKQTRDFCYVDNVVDANILAMQNKKSLKGETFNIAHSERISLIQIRTMIEKELGKKLPIEKRPSRIGDVRHTHADISKARKFIGFKPKVSFKEGLARTIKWHLVRK